MTKILSQAGISLADVYDIEGSIVGVDQLQSQDVSLIHEMGATILSERLSVAVRRFSTGAILQDADWGITSSDFPANVVRILGVQVFSDVASRVLRAGCLLRNPRNGREFPIWVWDQTNSIDLPFDDNGAGASLHQLLTPEPGMNYLPTLLLTPQQPQTLELVLFRGRTTSFGAGNVTVTMIVYVAHTELGGPISNYGLPVPSW